MPKENKESKFVEFMKHHRFVVVLALLLLGGVSFVYSAYATGQNVVDEPHVRWVSHTEYWSSSDQGEGAVASTIVRITDFRGDAFEVDECLANIYYPDKSIYIEQQPLQPSGPDGNWYRTDPIPDVMGHYEQEVICTYAGGETITTSQSFHVNPALNFIKVLDDNIDFTREDISGVNISLTGVIENQTTGLTSRIALAETNLENILSTLSSDVLEQFEQTQNNLSSELENVSIDLSAQLLETGQNITLSVQTATSNLTTLIESVNQQLLEELEFANAGINDTLVNVELNLNSALNATRMEILSALNTTAQDLSTALLEVEDNLQTQLTMMNLDIDARFTNTSVEILAGVQDSEEVIVTRLNNLEGSIEDLIQDVNFAVLDYLTDFLPAMNQTIADVSSDTQWIVQNAMNQEDRVQIDQRFDSVDQNLQELLQMCGTQITNESAFCREIFGITELVEFLREENTNYHDNLEEISLNTWSLLSGQIALNIDQILVQLNIIQSTTDDINATVSAMRQDQLDRVHIHILS